MPIGMEVGLGPGNFVFDGGPATPRRKGTAATHPIFGPCLLWRSCWMDQDATWYGGNRLPRRRCVRWGRSSSRKGAQPPVFGLSVYVYCGQTVGWMKTPLGMEVDLDPGHTVLDGVPALRERGTAAPFFSAHVYCGHGRPSQLLLSTCSTCCGGLKFSVPLTVMVSKNSNGLEKFWDIYIYQ